MLDTGAHSGQISEQTGVIEVIAFAGSDRGCRRTILNDALQSFELPLGGCQVFALCGRGCDYVARHCQQGGKDHAHAAGGRVDSSGRHGRLPLVRSAME
ncbi:hypothetical protein HMPREF2615_28745 [Pseudomonas aeruginosa]|nr:hypothetical protein HMPREF2615_28745 [Pseudomonas aeruginosa]